jgi:predicted AAA+ superfamily ATPase
MIKRKIKLILEQRLQRYPAVALVGPRQSGKTTLAKSLKGRYFDLEQDTDRLRLDLEWEQVCKGSKLIVLDEAQTWPEIFPRLRGEIDRDRKRNGRFLMLGSVSPALMTQVSESLAGRLSVSELSPLHWSELKYKTQKQRLWVYGGFPDGGVLDGKSFPIWQRDYLNLLVQRDLPNWGLPARAQTTNRLLQMLAVLHGQEWNASQVGKSLALSYHTVNSYLDYLEGAFLVRRLPSFHANIKKRLIKRPKVYWRDSGLLHALLNVSDEISLLNQPWVGASWEGFVIEQLLTALKNTDRLFDAYYLRTSDQHEIDLLIQFDTELWAFEIKLTSRPHPNDMARLNATADLVNADKRVLLCKQTDFIESKGQIISDLEAMIAYFSK